MTKIEHLILSNQLALMQAVTTGGRAVVHNVMMTRVFLEEQTAKPKPKRRAYARGYKPPRDDSQPA